jgi:hypothetical protein
MSAELRVHQENPEFWLTRGPGRDMGDVNNPGWTDGKRVELTGAGGGPVAIGAVDLTRLSDGELEQMRALMTRATPVLDSGEDK